MFDNVGKKIQGVSKALFWIGIGLLFMCEIAILFIGGITGNTEIIAIFTVYFLFGVPLTYISALFNYGIGKLIENSEILVNRSAEEE